VTRSRVTGPAGYFHRGFGSGCLPRHGGIRHTACTEGVDMKYTKPSLKRLGSLTEITLTTSASCDWSGQLS
jgi:hypothetical protein